MLPVDRIYVLNLDRRVDRWRQMQRRLEAVGLTADRFSAVDGCDPAIVARFQAIQSATLRHSGALGCLLSHIAIIRDAKAFGHERIAVFEDDVIFAHDFDTQLLDRLPEWDIVYLGATQPQWDNVVIQDGFYRPHRTLGTWAMLLHKNCFDRALAEYEKLEKTADLALSGLFHEDPKAFVLHPNLCITDIGDSDIRKWPDHKHLINLCRWDVSRYNVV